MERLSWSLTNSISTLDTPVTTATVTTVTVILHLYFFFFTLYETLYGHYTNNTHHGQPMLRSLVLYCPGYQWQYPDLALLRLQFRPVRGYLAVQDLWPLSVQRLSHRKGIDIFFWSFSLCSLLGTEWGLFPKTGVWENTCLWHVSCMLRLPCHAMQLSLIGKSSGGIPSIMADWIYKKSSFFLVSFFLFSFPFLNVFFF